MGGAYFGKSGWLLKLLHPMTAFAHYGYITATATSSATVITQCGSVCTDKDCPLEQVNVKLSDIDFILCSRSVNRRFSLEQFIMKCNLLLAIANTRNCLAVQTRRLVT